MATHTLTTRVSRRSMLAGSSAAATVSLLAAPAFSNDAWLIRLAGEHRRAQAALCDWIDAAERRLGPLGYEEPPYRARYDALCARENWLVAELARTRADGIPGFAAKLRASVCYDYAGEIPLDCDSRLLPPILDDLDRLAARA